MYCGKCGSKLEEDSKFCTVCGAVAIHPKKTVVKEIKSESPEHEEKTEAVKKEIKSETPAQQELKEENNVRELNAEVSVQDVKPETSAKEIKTESPEQEVKKPKKKNISAYIAAFVVLIAIAVIAALKGPGIYTGYKIASLLSEADKQLNDGDYSTALDSYDKVMDIDFENQDAVNGSLATYIAWGNALLAEGKYEDAISKYEKVLKKQKDNADAATARISAYIAWGSSLIQSADTEGGLGVLNGGYEKTASGDIGREIVKLYIELSRDEEAIKFSDELLDNKENSEDFNNEIRSLRGQAFNNILSEISVAYKGVLANHPDTALWSLADLDKDEVPEIIGVLTSGEVHIYTWKNNTLVQYDADQTNASYNAGSPDTVKAFRSKGSIIAELDGNYVELGNLYIKELPDDVQGLNRNYRKAIEAYTRALEIKPSDTAVADLRLSVYISLGDLLLKKYSYKEAEALFEEIQSTEELNTRLSPEQKKLVEDSLSKARTELIAKEELKKYGAAYIAALEEYDRTYGLNLRLGAEGIAEAFFYDINSDGIKEMIVNEYWGWNTECNSDLWEVHIWTVEGGIAKEIGDFGAEPFATMTHPACAITNDGKIVVLAQRPAEDNVRKARIYALRSLFDGSVECICTEEYMGDLRNAEAYVYEYGVPGEGNIVKVVYSYGDDDNYIPGEEAVRILSKWLNSICISIQCDAYVRYHSEYFKKNTINVRRMSFEDAIKYIRE